jgi:hypothetical protein
MIYLTRQGKLTNHMWLSNCKYANYCRHKKTGIEGDVSKIEEGKYELKSARLEKEWTLKISNHKEEMTPRHHKRRKEAQSQDPATLRMTPSFCTGARSQCSSRSLSSYTLAHAKRKGRGSFQHIISLFNQMRMR